MKPLDIVVLGLSLSSAWGNGHATTYRALLKAVAALGHRVLFLERDVPWYAAHRDLPDPNFCHLALYQDLAALQAWRSRIAEADAVIVGSYVPDGVAAGEFVQAHARGTTAFYDIDTPITLAKLARGEFDYISPALIPRYDVYLSFTGGPTLDRLTREFGARSAHPLYCSADPNIYRPLTVETKWDLSYLGTYSDDRQPVLDRLLLQPARDNPALSFVVAGSQYPDGIAWPANVERLDHVAPRDHPAFYAASRATLNVTRADMAAAGYSPSVRLFEAAACATPIISDVWAGIESFFEPSREIALAETAADVTAALRGRSASAWQAQAQAARHRVLTRHTPAHRAAELLARLAPHEPRLPKFSVSVSETTKPDASFNGPDAGG